MSHPLEPTSFSDTTFHYTQKQAPNNSAVKLLVSQGTINSTGYHHLKAPLNSLQRLFIRMINLLDSYLFGHCFLYGKTSSHEWLHPPLHLTQLISTECLPGVRPWKSAPLPLWPHLSHTSCHLHVAWTVSKAAQGQFSCPPTASRILLTLTTIITLCDNIWRELCPGSGICIATVQEKCQVNWKGIWL